MKKFNFPTAVKDLTTKAVKEFLDLFRSGKVEASLKSAEIPEDNSQPVKVIVGK